MRASLPSCEECEQMNKVFFGQRAIFKIWNGQITCILGKVFNLRYIWNREEFASYPLKTVIFTVSKSNTQDRETNIVHLGMGSPSHLHRIKLNFHKQKDIQWYFCYRSLKQIIVLVRPMWCPSVCLEKLLIAYYQFIFVTCIFLMTIWNSQKCYKKNSIYFLKQ